MNKSIMSEEAFNELIDGFEYVKNLTKYGKENIKYHVQKLQQENKILKENAENNDKVVELLKEENEHLRNTISARENVCDRLAGNWNLLKRYCYESGNDENTKLNGLNMLDKMQELEKVDNYE